MKMMLDADLSNYFCPLLYHFATPFWLEAGRHKDEDFPEGKMGSNIGIIRSGYKVEKEMLSAVPYSSSSTSCRRFVIVSVCLFGYV